jgi:predicted translin family RNA/ssDNA-binding protein
MDKEMLKQILETVTNYYRDNNNILPDDITEELKQQIEYLERLINRT